MNEIKIVWDDSESLYNVPSTFDELSREQFIAAGHKLLCEAAQIEDDDFYFMLSGIEKSVWKEIPAPKRYAIKQLFDFIHAPTPTINRQLLPFIEIQGIRFIGYQPSFSNTTWQEFIFADQYIINRKFKEAAAVLYRQQRKHFSGETDRRVSFTIYGTDNRLQQYFEQISPAELFCFVLNYKALRKYFLEEKYPFIFSRQPQKLRKSDAAGFSWVGIHRDLMGDQFFDEDKFFNSNVHVILNRLNRVIKDSNRK